MTNGEGGSGTKIDPSSPYYLGPQDKPGDTITHIRLTLDNFDEWVHDVRVALKSRRKYVFVNGTINEPKPPCSDDDWETIHFMLVSWLSRTISDEAGLRDCHQSEGMSVTVYYGKLCQLWDDLDKHQPIIECKCYSNCTSVKQHLDRRESDRLHQFLLGLISAHYASLRSVILAQNPLPTVARAYHMVCQEERVRGFDKPPETSTEIASFNVRSQGLIPNKPPSQMSRTERQQLYYNHCKRSGHDRSMCFDLTGEVPDWYYELQKQRRSSGRGSSARGRGSGSGSRSNQECSSRGDGLQPEATNSVQTNPPKSTADAATSAASLVTLSDALHCEFITNATSCTIQDRATREAIGTGERLDGLYYLCQKPEEVNVVTAGSSDFKLWHNRLGHPSEQIVKLLPFLRNSKHSLSKPCEGGLPIRFWGECALAAAFVINRTPSRLLNGATPYELIFKSPPNFDMLRVFGSLCFAHNQRSKGDKFASRSRKCVFMGYPSGQKGWYLYDLDRQDFFVSRDVKFYEDQFPFLDKASATVPSPAISSDTPATNLIIEWDDETADQDPTSPVNNPEDTPPATPSSTAGSPLTGPSGPMPDSSSPSPPTGRGHRARIPSTNLRDYVLDFDSDDNDSSPSSAAPLHVSTLTSGTPYPLANYLSCNKFSSPHRSYLAALMTHTEPQNFKEAAQSKEWRAAMESEMKALIDNKT
ncbi:uncharacterized protein LOC141646649 [Silene latifolia]|uniref:uncharacterized protein LOC141646649 n=1 Tax=Silene latifolia TaxID=37657 RepID=UPI003D784F9F